MSISRIADELWVSPEVIRQTFPSVNQLTVDAFLAAAMAYLEQTRICVSAAANPVYAVTVMMYYVIDSAETHVCTEAYSLSVRVPALIAPIHEINDQCI